VRAEARYSTLYWPGACALKQDGTVYCWGPAGTSAGGLLGDGSTNSTFPSSPVQVPGLTGVTAISSGSQVCALTPGGVVKCWGGDVPNAAPQWGFPGSYVPTPVPGLPAGIQGLAQGLPGEWAHQCAWTTSAIWCWGTNDVGQLGDGTTTSSASAVRVKNLPSGVISWVAVGDWNGPGQTCARIGGHDYCWGGLNPGNGQWAITPTPVPVTGL
jgi:hypothetical protein